MDFYLSQVGGGGLYGEMTFEVRPEWRRQPREALGKGVLGRGASKCKCPEVGMRLVSLWDSREGNGTRVGRVKQKVSKAWVRQGFGCQGEVP